MCFSPLSVPSPCNIFSYREKLARVTARRRFPAETIGSRRRRMPQATVVVTNFGCPGRNGRQTLPIKRVIINGLLAIIHQNQYLGPKCAGAKSRSVVAKYSGNIDYDTSKREAFG